MIFIEEIKLPPAMNVFANDSLPNAAEELTKYLMTPDIFNSDVDTLERVEIMQDLRKGVYDVLVGVNSIRRTDLP
jgi:excinuclease ABC subunit B